MCRLPVCLSLALCCSATSGSDIPPPRLVDVNALVRQLGSDDFAIREEASRRLATLHVDAPPPELLAAQKSPNAEIRDRARRAVAALNKHIVRELERIATAQLPREERFARRGQVDLYVASTAANKLKPYDDRLWLPAFELGVTTAAKAELKGDRLPQGPARVKHFPTYKKILLENTMIRTDGIFTRGRKDYFVFRGAILAGGVDEPQSIEGLIVSRAAVRIGKHLNHSLLIATGDVVVGGSAHRSAIICDGDVTVNGMGGSFVIARGNVTVDGSGFENTIFAGGTVVFKKPIQLPNQQTVPKGMEDRIHENVLRPLDFITFFELFTVGVEVKREGKVVRVTAITDDKPFAEAGVKVGDIVAQVNGKKPESAESLRRLLRDALAIGDATIQLERGGKIVTVKVSLPE